MKHDTDDWSLMLLPDPEGRKPVRRVQPQRAPAPTPQETPRHPAAILDGMRDRLDGLLHPGKAIAPTRRFYGPDGRVAGLMQITRRKG
ncbi:hypothetical protein [Xenophilus azovorans]|uniref:hypothetical protein n=1 Tax=Xenophilus azovorans TaxID=151755 RepID=UPI0005705800|nr:hypothetical protein [Xenophilus azovorans]